MLLDWKDPDDPNDSTPHGHLQIQRNPCQNAKDTVHRSRTNSLQVCLEAQQTHQSQSHPEQERGSWRNQAPGPQTLSYKQQSLKPFGTGTKPEMDIRGTGWKPRRKPMHLQSTPL